MFKLKSRRLRIDSLEPRLALSAVSFAEHEMGPLDGNQSVVLADMDGDGDLDAVAATSDLPLFSGAVHWYENDGSGGFTEHTVSDLRGVTAVTAADMDGDGDLDVAATSSFIQGERFRHAINWYENIDGNGTFSSSHMISENRGISIRAADVNNDGRVDLVVANVSWVNWYANLGMGEFEEHTLHSRDFGFALDVIPFDADNDGDADLLLMEDDTVRWINNVDGLGTYEPGGVIRVPGRGNEVHTAYPADMDNDGQVDVVISTNQQVAWYRIEDNGFSLGGVISGPGNSEIAVADFDGDGDFDVIGDLSSPGTQWFENREGSFEPHSVSVAIPRSIAVADIDGDGRTDMLAGISQRSRGQWLVWYENRPPGDANDDGVFDSSDLVQIFQAGKYNADEGTSYDEGDWNGDGRFDSADLVFAFQSGTFVAETGVTAAELAAAADWLFAVTDRAKSTA